MTEQPDETTPDAPASDETATAATPVDETTPEPAKPRKGLLIGLVGGVAVVLALVLLYVFVYPDSPSTVVDDYFKAVKAADVDELKGLTCSAGVDPFASMDPIDNDEDRALWEELFRNVSWNVTGESVDGDKATVTVQLKGLGEKPDADDSVNLVKEGMYWKVCDSVVDDLGN